MIAMLLGLFGGLGMFIYGMHLMSEGLRVVAGTKMRNLIDRFTATPLKALVTGVLITFLTQSSSATSVMVVGFVNASLMNLYQATGIILGSNIGTTIMSQIIAFDITQFATFFIGLGVLMALFMKKKRGRDWGSIVLGFGILFYGIYMMSQAVTPLKDSPEFTNLLLTYGKNPLIGLFISTAMTAVLQSSGAVIGLIQALALSGVFSSASGTEAIQICIPLVVGSNIGTCITAILSSIGTSRTAKDAAYIHLFDKIIGAIWVLTLMFLLDTFLPVNPFYEFLVRISGKITIDGQVVPNVARQVAMFHTIYNIANVLILFPFIKQIVDTVTKIYPPDEPEEGLALDQRLLNTPGVAIGQAETELIKMSRITAKNFGRAIDALITLDKKKIKKVEETEQRIDEFESGLQEYMIKITNLSATKDQYDRVAFIMENSHNIESIGDHAMTLAGIAGMLEEKELKLTPGMLDALQTIKSKTGIMLDEVTNILEDPTSTRDLDQLFREEDFLGRATCS